jgi:hypothetical protein
MRLRGESNVPLTPLFTSPCDLADRLPPLIADFLDLEITLMRRFREESVSDMLVACLLRLAGADISVQVPINEAVTGNDFDIIVYDPPSRRAVQYRIQAKRLTPHPTEWAKGSYRELAHTHNTGTQSAALIRSSAAEPGILTLPLYAFYNPARTCVASGGRVSGLALADGHAVRGLVARLVKAKPSRPPLKRLSTLRPYFFPLSTLLCPEPPVSGRRIPTPDESLRAVESAIEAGAARARRGRGTAASSLATRSRDDAASRDTQTTRLGINPPRVLSLALNNRGSSDRFMRTKVKRPRIVLFTG